MAKKAETKTAKPRKVRAWTKEDVRMLKALARKLKPTERATYQKALALGVTLVEVGGRRGREVNPTGRV